MIAELAARLLRKDEHGNYVHDPRDVRHALPLVVLELQLPLAELPDGLRRLVVETAAAAGVRAAGGVDAARAALRAYYEARPPNRAVLAEIERALDPGPDDAARRAVGATSSARPVGTDPKPQGALSRTEALLKRGR